MNILTENEINIKSLEKYFYDYGCRIAAEAFANYLQELDSELMKNRDKELLRNKGHRKTCIKTLMGEVEYSRTVYQVMDNECEKKFVYLLDEYVGFEKIGFISANLVETIESLTNFETPEYMRKPSMNPLLSAAKVPKKEGKGYEGKHTSIPYVNSALSNGRKELINWLKGRNYSISYF